MERYFHCKDFVTNKKEILITACFIMAFVGGIAVGCALYLAIYGWNL